MKHRNECPVRLCIPDFDVRGYQLRLGHKDMSLPACGAVFMLLLFLVLLIHPSIAYADYSIDKVSIDATVSPDGSVRVAERRTYSFDDSYNGVYWMIPTGKAADGRTIETSIEEVGIVAGDASFDDEAGFSGRPQSFEEVTGARNGMDGVYEVSDESSNIQVKLYHPVDYETVTYQIVYTDSNLAVRYRDCAELYWKFVSDGWDVDSNDVTCTIHLPLPADAQINPGKNVRAWGHGVDDGATVSFDGNKIVYKAASVNPDSYAEARVVFPESWLSAASSQDSDQLDKIVSEEQTWADETNARRARRQMMCFAALLAAAVIAVISLVLSIRFKLRYNKQHHASFDDVYFRDVPSNDHPAVLGCLWNDGGVTPVCLTASLMRLTDEGYIVLEAESGSSRAHKRGSSYRIVRTDKPYRASSDEEDSELDIDRATLSFIFGKVKPLAAPDTARSEAISFSEIEHIAKTYQQEYCDAYESWQGVVTAAASKRGFFVDAQESYRAAVIVFGILSLLAFVVPLLIIVSADHLDIPLLSIAIADLVICVLAGVVCLVAQSRMLPRSAEAVELTAKLKALKKWLRDFTRLEEAIPSDVVLWNRLLVMAIVLGVSDEVIKQLKVAASQVLQDETVAPIYGWYAFGSSGHSPATSFTKMSEAHSTSSDYASGSGSGGGFSSGGGGGFGGGGGGGAF